MPHFILSIHLFMGYIHLFAIEISAAMNTGMQISVWILFSIFWVINLGLEWLSHMA